MILAINLKRSYKKGVLRPLGDINRSLLSIDPGMKITTDWKLTLYLVCFSKFDTDLKL